MWISFNTLMFYFYRYNRWKHAVGKENIPAKGAVIFCSNHTNAFMDPILVGSTYWRRSWFLARSDVFRKKTLAKFLSFIGIVPIYRLQEGVENLAKNDDTFDKCSLLLGEEKAIIIFSEGLCVQERRLRKLKKGTARIALGTEEKHDFKLGLKIVPVGVNYSATPWKFRSRVSIRYGEPFDVKDYEEIYRKDKPRAINQFTKDLEEKMKKLVVVIEEDKNDEVVAHLEEMLFAKQAQEKNLDVSNPAHTYAVSCAIAEKINAFEKRSPHQSKEFRHEVKTYFEELKKKKLRDRVLNEYDHRRVTDSKVLFYILFFITGLPLHIFGVITNYIPYKIPWLIQKKVVKQIEWSASVNGTIGVYFWQIWWLLQSLAVALIFRNWYLLLAFMLLVPVSGLHAQAYWVYVKRFSGSLRWWMTGKEEGNKLMRMRTGILSRFEELN